MTVHLLPNPGDVIVDHNPEVILPAPGNTRKQHKKTSATGKTMMKAALAVGLALGASKLLKESDFPGHGPTKEIVQPGKTFGQCVSISREYYLNHRPDLADLSEEVLLSLAQGRARLMMYAHELQNGSLSLENFLGIIKSPKKIIADEKTKLHIHHDFPTSLKRTSFIGRDMEFFTEQDVPNMFLESAKVVGASVNGDTLELDIGGRLASLNTINKYSAFADFEGEKEPVGPIEYTLRVKILPN